MFCKLVCLNYKSKRPSDGKRYIAGQKRCQYCEVFINWDGSRCPCCKYKLRTSPRGSKWKRIHVVEKSIN